MITLFLFLVLSAVLVPLIQRDLRHAAERQRRRRLYRIVRHAVVTITLDTRAFNAAMRKASFAAADLERSMAQARAAFKVHGSKSGRFTR